MSRKMEVETIQLSHLPYNQKARIIRLDGGYGFRNKLNVMGIREGEIITVISKQPLLGPITVAVDSCQITLGRGMTRRIMVEKI